MRFFAFIAVVLLGGLLISAVGEFPKFGDAHSPANASTTLSQKFITETETDTMVPNMVTAVLADYRGYDTMFETVVVFTGGIAIFAILRTFRREDRREPVEAATHGLEPSQTDSGRVIVATTVKLVVPVIQLFALYVLAHGHHSPGGGFQGGVILGASFILLALVTDLPSALKRFSEGRFLTFAAVGILIYAGTGLVCQFLGAGFLDYEVLAKVLPDFIDNAASKSDEALTLAERGKWARSHAMLIVEIGVAFTVAAIMFAIYSLLSSNGRLRGGL